MGCVLSEKAVGEATPGRQETSTEASAESPFPQPIDEFVHQLLLVLPLEYILNAIFSPFHLLLFHLLKPVGTGAVETKKKSRQISDMALE